MTTGPKSLYAFLWLACALFAPAALSHAAGCAPVSASITYEADDYFFFYINGNLVVNGTVFDAGAPPVTVPIPVADFAPAGSPNYFAGEVTNSVANLIGAAWVINISCADGSMSYITSMDNTFTMYDDVAGSSPPPAAWITPAWTDPGNLFNQAPIQAPPLAWFNPPLKHPLTGATLPVLSHSASGTQGSLTEKLYFRESVILTEITPTVTPTPYPTVCGATPALVQSTVLATGCAGSGNPTSFSMTIPANPGQVLLAQVESTGPVLSGVTWNGAALTQLPGSPVAITSGNLYTYYMVNPPPGTFTLAFNVTSGCSWNAVATLYKNIDTASPFGTIKTNGGNGATFSDSITTVSPYSILHDFLAYPNGPFTFSGLTGTQLFASSASGCCNDVYGSSYVAAGPGPYSLNYTQSSGAQNWWAETIELKAVTSCGTPSFTPTRTRTPSPSFTPTVTVQSPTFTPTPSRTATPTNTVQTPTFTVTPTRTSTATASVTPSVTATPTRSVTPSSTNTSLITPTETATPTQTPTRTVTPTATATATSSASPSSTLTRTATPTATATRTVTATPTDSITTLNTQTDTSTVTLSSTQTLSPSSTRTVTATPTGSITTLNTQTDTSTVTLSSTQTATASPTRTVTATPTDSITTLNTRTDTSTATPTASITTLDTPTDTATLTVTPSQTPSRTVTSTDSPTSSVTATPSETAPASATETRTATPTSTASPSGTVTRSITATASRTASPSATPTVTLTLSPPPSPTQSSTPTPVPPAPATPFHLSVMVYNSAGEQVRLLYNGASQGLPGGFQISAGALVPGSGAISLAFSAPLQGVSNVLLWQGQNDGGQAVAGGIYSIKVEESDPFGRITAWTHEVTVIPTAPAQTLNIYNAAGELVRRLDLASVGTGDLLTELSLGDAGSAAFVIPDSPGAGAGLQLRVGDVKGNQSLLAWDGRNSQGQAVASGSYSIQLLSQMDGGPVVVASRSVLALKDPASQAAPDVRVAPDPVGPQDPQINFVYGALPAGRHALVTLYNLAGERVAQGAAEPGADRIVLAVGNWASGVYLAAFEVKEGGALCSRRVLHLALRR